MLSPSVGDCMSGTAFSAKDVSSPLGRLPGFGSSALALLLSKLAFWGSKRGVERANCSPTWGPPFRSSVVAGLCLCLGLRPSPCWRSLQCPRLGGFALHWTGCVLPVYSLFLLLLIWIRPLSLRTAAMRSPQRWLALSLICNGHSLDVRAMCPALQPRGRHR